MENYLLLLLFIASAILNISLAIYGWLRRQLPGAAAFSLAMLLFAFLPVTQAVNIVDSDLTIKVIALKSRVELAGIGAIAWLVMIMQLTGYAHLVNRRLLAALSIVPLVVFILNWTEHPLFRSGYSLDASGTYPELHWTNGPLFWVGLVYLNALFLMPLYLLWRSHGNISPLSLRQTWALSVSTILPLIVNVLSQVGLPPMQGVNFPFAAGPLMGLIVTWAVFRHHLFDMVPIARGLLIENMRDGVMVVDTKSRIVDINPAMQAMIGSTVIGQSAEAALAAWPDLVTRFKDISEAQTEIVVAGNPPQYFDLRISPMSEPGGRLTGRLVVVRDITRLKQTEAALRASENNLRRMLEAAPDAMLIVDQAGKIVLVNLQCEKMFGYSQAELLGQAVESLIFEPLREAHRLNRADYYRNPQARPMGASSKWNLNALRKDGSSFPIEISLSPLESETGLLTIAAVRDMAERKQIEAQMHLQSAALEAAAHAIVITDYQDVIRWVNPAFTRLTGYSAAEAIGQTAQLTRSDRHKAAFYENIQATIHAGLVWEGEIVNRRKDGSEYVEEQTSTPVHDQNGQISHFIAIKQDITARRQIEDALRQQKDYLVALHQISLDLLNRRNVDDLLQAIVDRVAEFLNAPFAEILLVEGDELVTRAFTQNQPFLSKDRVKRGEANLSWQAFDTRQPASVNDYAQWSLRRKLHEEQHLSAVVALPILVGERCIGVLDLSRPKPGKFFDDSEIKAGTLFAQLAALVLDNTELVTNAIRQSQELSLLHEVRTAISGEIDLAHIVKRTVEAIAETFGYTLVSLYLREGDLLVLQHQVGYEQVIPTIPINKGVIGKVIQTSQPVLLEDVRTEPAFLGAIEGIVSEVAVPVLDEGRVVGVLNIESHYGVKLTESDLRLMLALSDQISVAIGRARLYADLSRNNERLSTLHRVTIDILNQRDLDELLQSITDQVVTIVDANAGYIALVAGDELVDRAVSPRDFPYQKVAAGKDNSPAWQVFESHEIFITDDFSSLPGIRPQTKALGIKAAVLLPVMAGVNCLGVLGTGRMQPGYLFSEEDINFGNLFARIAGVALDNAQLHETLRQESIRDPLTSLFNRRFMEEALSKEIKRAERNARPLAVVMLDLDYFKRINDTFGHDAGDEALRQLSLLIQSKTRGSDIVCRYGGEEFTLILPDAYMADAVQRMDQLRQDIKQLTIQHQGKSLTQFTGSFGLAIFPEHGSTVESLIKAADRALYRAKQSGRDRVITA